MLKNDSFDFMIFLGGCLRQIHASLLAESFLHWRLLEIQMMESTLFIFSLYANKPIFFLTEGK